MLSINEEDMQLFEDAKTELLSILVPPTSTSGVTLLKITAEEAAAYFETLTKHVFIAYTMFVKSSVVRGE